MKYLASILALAIGLSTIVYAGDRGQSGPIDAVTYTISGGGSLTITNVNPTGTAQWWTSIEVQHTNDIATAEFAVTRTRDGGYPFTIWAITAYTNSAAVELAPRAIKNGDVITFTVTNPVGGEETKVYVTRQSN